MIKKIKNLKKIELILVISLICLFFIKQSNILDYGLPFFQQEDEGAFLKSTISFVSFLSGIKSELLDPFFGSLINLLLTLKLLFINELLINSLSLSEIKQKIYNDPSILIIYGRYNSLIVTTLCFFLLHLIFKKLKINFLVYFPLLVSLSLSLFTSTISLVNGKNSFYLFFFLLQLYFLIKYYFQIDKFNKYTYSLFSILASLSWGINYWCSIVSFYGILVLHLKKFKFKNYHYLSYFLLGFIILGLFPSLFFEDYFFLNFFSRGGETESFIIIQFLEKLFTKFLFSFEIILNTEIFMVIYFSLFIFYIFKNLENKKIIILLTILIFEPILIFGIAGDEVVPELRYLSGLICLMYILSALMVKDLSNYYKSKFIIPIFILLNIAIIIDKTVNYVNLNNVISQNHSFINFFEKNKNINQDTLYLGLDTRKNLKNLDLYKNLHEKKIITNKLFKKDNYQSILKKIDLEKKSNEELKNKKIIDLNVMNINLFDIQNYKIFFEEIEKKYKYVTIQENNDEKFNNLFNYVKSNYHKVDQTFDQKDLNYNNSLRDIFKFLYKGGSAKKLDNFILGNNYSLYKLN